jgi:mRNA interferase HicA
LIRSDLRSRSIYRRETGKRKIVSISAYTSLDIVTKNDYTKLLTSKELKHWLEKQGATFTPGRGSHLHVELNGKFSVLPMHGKDLGPLATTIKMQLGLK